MLAFFHSGADFIFIVLLALPFVMAPLGTYLIARGQSFAVKWIGGMLLLTAVALVIWWYVYV